MNLKSIEQRITTLEARRQRGDTIPEWWADVPADLKRDVIRMGERVKAAGGLSADPYVLKIANRLATFITTRHDRRGVAT